jgi:hypothetical protein
MASKFETDGCTCIGAKTLQQLTTRAIDLIVSLDNWRRKNPRQNVGQEFVVLWEQFGVLEEEQSTFKAKLPPCCVQMHDS